MKKLVIYGDLHGKFNLLPHLRRKHSEADEIIIAGDMGVGFPGPSTDHLLKYGNQITATPKVRFIRGNHDSPEACTKFVEGGVTWIPDGTLEEGILFLGGGWSIDGPTGLPEFRNYRTPGVNWWEDEELTEAQWERIFNSLEGRYEEVHTVVSHDGPSGVIHRILGAHKPIFNTTTSNTLELLRGRLPSVKMWVFGHYHLNRTFEIGDTMFRCLADDGSSKVEIEIG